MHLRRALLLFAIVLGVAALAAGLSRPVERSDEREEPSTTVPAPADSGTGGPIELRFSTARPRRRALPAGAAAQVLVEVSLPGQVEIPELGLSATADPVTAARFDVLGDRPGRYPIEFVPAGDSSDPEPAGTLVIEAAAPEV